MNLYAYVQNNPMRFLDPEGLMVRWASDKIETRITETASYLETGLNIFSDYMTEHSAGIEQDVQGVIENSGVENLQATLNTMALTYGVSESILWGGAAFSPSLSTLKAAATDSVGVGGFSFGSEILISRDLEKATKSFIIDGITTFVSVSSAISPSTSAFATATSTMAINAALQKTFNGSVNYRQTALSIAPPSMGAVLISRTGLSGKSFGAVHTLISGPMNVAIKTLSNE